MAHPFLHRLLDTFLPRYCVVCQARLQSNERALCITCLTQLPRPSLPSCEDNEVARRLWSEVPIARAAVLCYYLKQSETRRLFEAMKYQDRIDLCHNMGQVLASTLLPQGFFRDIEVILPIPLSRQRLRQRGYNQAAYIARGISRATGIPLDTHTLWRQTDNASQTTLARNERRENVKDIFALRQPSLLGRGNASLPAWEGKHLLLVDDIITTGATLSSAAATLQRAFPHATFSVAAIGLTHEE